MHGNLTAFLSGHMTSSGVPVHRDLKKKRKAGACRRARGRTVATTMAPPGRPYGRRAITPVFYAFEVFILFFNDHF